MPTRPPRRRPRASQTGGTGQRQRRVNLRLAEEEYDEIAEAAAERGVTVAGYVAAAALAAAGDELPPDARECIIAILARRQELARIGTNLNQIARALNTGGHPPPDRLGQALAEHRALLQRLDIAAQDLGTVMQIHRARLAERRRPQQAEEEPAPQEWEDWFEPM